MYTLVFDGVKNNGVVQTLQIMQKKIIKQSDEMSKKNKIIWKKYN